jgi:hypothetical protein
MAGILCDCGVLLNNGSYSDMEIIVYRPEEIEKYRKMGVNDVLAVPRPEKRVWQCRYCGRLHVFSKGSSREKCYTLELGMESLSGIFNEEYQKDFWEDQTIDRVEPYIGRSEKVICACNNWEALCVYRDAEWEKWWNRDIIMDDFKNIPDPMNQVRRCKECGIVQVFDQGNRCIRAYREHTESIFIQESTTMDDLVEKIKDAFYPPKEVVSISRLSVKKYALEILKRLEEKYPKGFPAEVRIYTGEGNIIIPKFDKRNNDLRGWVQ